MKQKISALLFGTALTLAASGALAQDKNIKIGVLTDNSGLYSDLGGAGSTLAAQMAIEDSGLAAKGWKIDVISADHQNKPDIATTIARQWIDVEKVDIFMDVLNSGVALAVNNLVKEKNAVMINTGAATSDLTNAQCSPNTIHWVYDTYMLANSTGQALVKAGGDTWYFLTADYAFGHALERDTAAVVTKSGGKVIGTVRHPLNSSDFSSFLLQAQASKAKIVGMANAGGDTTNTIKQASEFGIVSGGQKLAGLLLFITDVHSLGLKVAQGLSFTETFYWDLNDDTRAFSKRFSERMKNKAMPSMVQAGVYSGLIHYFKTLDAMGGNPHDGIKVVEKMKAAPTEDPLFGKGTIRADGRKLHPAYLFEVKKPSESKGPWDYYKLIGTTPGDQAFRPLSESACPLVKK
ncbi:ABC transporter substrate-binding protein [Bradyrhizobium sp. AUGA SZCCT0240]|jgi:branched-chain amino acid transport system substrate-binding protein|uniref:ABC transporter substrate-binding protein n=1 Tax=unclassified Bradyrhizobium TaxID=2631580 RepID=UPI001BA5181D|nr:MULTISPECIES: ABC transporter substrate-binding protein [unclassified Bradyrhizobium]MBR1190755.1 ABC transporter substrate-binding protein [Bradyrhizobium sp. AUGA SZCCT0160]MBR1195966.1 ABC transporter substrate-binding protein [Bradyrhizobium sp. AUGA SZCCT0158]MBR1240803.1 ABC transporter substrate-binding protein [Bradyrhizobium sp. AUGA SZCCT0274]MBR1246585.1 ABC transporter substrate-binding protein [Bradyrhizobium sp. AUGA SZCCT0169]MBR1252173.1 ABC transporter substrate-binding pro